MSRKKKKLPTVRKPTAPPTQQMKTRKGELDRKRKHKGEKDEELLRAPSS